MAHVDDVHLLLCLSSLPPPCLPAQTGDMPDDRRFLPSRAGRRAERADATKCHPVALASALSRICVVVVRLCSQIGPDVQLEDSRRRISDEAEERGPKAKMRRIRRRFYNQTSPYGCGTGSAEYRRTWHCILRFCCILQPVTVNAHTFTEPKQHGANDMCRCIVRLIRKSSGRW
jgi:hypothetical protein